MITAMSEILSTAIGVLVLTAGLVGLVIWVRRDPFSGYQYRQPTVADGTALRSMCSNALDVYESVRARLAVVNTRAELEISPHQGPASIR